MCMLHLLFRSSSCSDSTTKRGCSKCSSNESNLRQDVEHYDVIRDEDVTDLPLRTPGTRSLPPLPTAAVCNYNDYAKLNYVPATGNTRQVDDAGYNNISETGLTNHKGYLNAHCDSSTENVDKVDDVDNDVHTNTVVIVTMPEVEKPQDKSLDASGYLKLYHVPSTEDVSQLDDVANNHAAKMVSHLSGSGHVNGMDRDGCLMVRHAPSPKNVHKVDDNRLESNLIVNASPRTDPGNEDSVDR